MRDTEIKAIRDRYAAGDSVESLAQDYVRPPETIGAAKMSNDPKELVERLRLHNEAIDRELADARAIGEILKGQLSATVGDFRLVLYGDTITIIDTNREQRRRPGELPLHLCEQACTELTRLASLGPLPENVRGLIQW